MQQNWIGKSRGLEFAFDLIDGPDGHEDIAVYTTRPDTLLGASFVGISADHPLARHLEKSNPEIAAFNKECRQMSTSEADMEKAEKKVDRLRNFSDIVRTGLSKTLNRCLVHAAPSGFFPAASDAL